MTTTGPTQGELFERYRETTWNLLCVSEMGQNIETYRKNLATGLSIEETEELDDARDRIFKKITTKL